MTMMTRYIHISDHEIWPPRHSAVWASNMDSSSTGTCTEGIFVQREREETAQSDHHGTHNGSKNSGRLYWLNIINDVWDETDDTGTTITIMISWNDPSGVIKDGNEMDPEMDKLLSLGKSTRWVVFQPRLITGGRRVSHGIVGHILFRPTQIIKNWQPEIRCRTLRHTNVQGPDVSKSVVQRA